MRSPTGLREDYGLRPRAVDGTLQAAWVVLDYFDVIVHVMRQDVRERYDLETLWGDAPAGQAAEARPGESVTGGRAPDPEAEFRQSGVGQIRTGLRATQLWAGFPPRP